MKHKTHCASLNARVLEVRGVSRINQNHPVLLLCAAVLALALIAGCSSVPMGGNSDAMVYNPSTGYPAVGNGR